MRISDWSSDVCSSDLLSLCYTNTALTNAASSSIALASRGDCPPPALPSAAAFGNPLRRTIHVGSTSIPSMSPIISKAAKSEEHTYELQSLMRITYAVVCLTNNLNIVSAHIRTQNHIT